MAKLLSKRISLTMHCLIGETLSAFVKGRQMLDGALIANEVVHWARKRKEKSILLKLNFQKAYDMVRWSFVNSILEVMGFSSKLRKWISYCLSSTFVPIIVNGSLCPPFKMHRGRRQGDPLSPFLFVSITEVFNRLVSKAKSYNIFKAYK